MFDLHQGFTDEEQGEAPATVGAVALAELDVASSLARGRYRVAARQQLAAWKLLGQVAAEAVRDKLKRR